MQPSRLRLVAASTCLGAPLAVLVFVTHGALERAILASLLGAALLFQSRALAAQVLARGVAWMMLVIGAFAMFAKVHEQDPEALHVLGRLSIALGSGAALLLARPALDSDRALATFGPVRFRGWFLGVMAAAVGITMFLALFGYEGIHHHHRRAGIASFVLAVGLVVSAVGVLRMRGWGIAAAGVTSAFGAGLALLMFTGARGVIGFADGLYFAKPFIVFWSIATAVAAAFIAPVVMARFARAGGAEAGASRVTFSAVAAGAVMLAMAGTTAAAVVTIAGG